MKFSPIKIGVIVVAALVALIFIFGSVFTVQEGHRAVVLQSGKYSSTASPGLSFKFPLIQSVTQVDVRTQNTGNNVTAGTKDLQNVSTTVGVNYRLNALAVDKIYSNVGLANIEQVISKRISESVTAVVAQYNAENLLKQRETVKTQIVDLLSKKLLPYHIIVEDVQITNFKFSEAYARSIESKQIAEQEALTAKHKTAKVTEEAKQAIEKAKGEAEAIRIQSEAIKANGGQAYIDLQAVKAWDGKLPDTIMGNGSLPFVNVGK